MAGKGEGNGRVTMAVLGTKLDTAIELLAKLERGPQADHDRIAALEGELERVKDRQSVVTMAVTAVNVVVSNVAAWLWTRR